jgi:hypothetical protein
LIYTVRPWIEISQGLKVVPVSSIGYVVRIAGLGAVAVMVRVRSQVEAVSFLIEHFLIDKLFCYTLELKFSMKIKFNVAYEF